MDGGRAVCCARAIKQERVVINIRAGTSAVNLPAGHPPAGSWLPAAGAQPLGVPTVGLGIGNPPVNAGAGQAPSCERGLQNPKG